MTGDVAEMIVTVQTRAPHSGPHLRFVFHPEHKMEELCW